MLTGFSKLVTTEDSQASSFQQFLSKINPNAAWVVQNIEVIGDWNQWATQGKHNLRGVSDGSFKEKFGTASFILLPAEDSRLSIRGRLVTPGSPEDQNAYRSELSGIYALTVMIWAVSTYFNVPSGHMEIACDGKSALQQAQWPEDFINTQYPHFDLILAIRSIRQLTKWKWSWRHVKGHQDDTGGPLDEWAQLNIQMDSYAKQHWLDTQNLELSREQKLWGEPWRVWTGQKVTSHLSRALQEFCSSQPAAAYWRSKARVGELFNLVDWDAIGGAMKQVPMNRRTWISKHVTGFCATGHNMFRRKARPSAQCPRCPLDESPEHVWTCQGAEATSVWKKSLGNLKQWLQENSTHPEMTKAIIEYLDGWRNSRNTLTNISQSWIFPAIKDQEKLGWRNFLEGLPTMSWQEAQKTYFLRIGSRRSPKRWVILLIQKLWDVAWDMWEHRNGILHDKEQSIILQNLHNDIREEFARGNAGLTPEARTLFNKGCEAVLAQPAEVKLQWLARVKLARTRIDAKKALGSSYGKERKVMANWLQGTR
jgi:hypothetical protein